MRWMAGPQEDVTDDIESRRNARMRRDVDKHGPFDSAVRVDVGRM